MVNTEARRTAAPAVAAGVTLGLAAACWLAAVPLMGGMDMGVASRPGSFWVFEVTWTVMMAAMMLPGAAPAVASRARLAGEPTAVALFVGAYLGLWAMAGIAVYAVDRPHGTLAAGVVVIAAGLYEFTPVKRECRRRCRAEPCTGLGYGLRCAGSSIGLMAVLVALDVMSLPWMAVIAALACAQKLLPARAAIDAPLALALIAVGITVVCAPSLVPGLTPPAAPAMPAMPM
jgi:predicted metal-binding membrane protein